MRELTTEETKEASGATDEYVQSVALFEFSNELVLSVDGKQPPWKPTGRSAGAAAVDDVIPTVVLTRTRKGDGSAVMTLQVHNLSVARKVNLAGVFEQAAQELRNSPTEDAHSFNCPGFSLDITAALREVGEAAEDGYAFAVETQQSVAA